MKRTLYQTGVQFASTAALIAVVSSYAGSVQRCVNKPAVFLVDGC